MRRIFLLFVFAVILCAEDVNAPLQAESPAAPEPEALPHFEPIFDDSASFFENFQGDWQSRWIHSENPEYSGDWKVEEPEGINVLPGDKWLTIQHIARKYGLSAKVDPPIDMTDKPLVIQYEVMLQRPLDCGGAYMKLLRETPELDLKKLESSTPYVIMFGPDKCGPQSKVHFIFQHRNPVSGKYEEKHLKTPPEIKNDNISHLYTLVIRPDNSFSLSIDNTRVRSGSLLEEFSPAVNPPEEIDDPEDLKPSDWVDDQMMDDPEAKKPEDWDEDEPEMIVDADAQMPENWYPDEPEYIADPAAEKPAEWNDEEDGQWVPPQIRNPKCEESNCGKWEPPMIANPKFKGKWVPPKIPNPAYKGVWAPRKIKNPYFFVDNQPHNMDKIGAVAFELWTMTSHISFNNIYIGHDPAAAKAYADRTFVPRHKLELKILAEQEKFRKSQVRGKQLERASFLQKLQIYTEMAIEHPFQAIVGAAVTLAALGISLWFCLGRRKTHKEEEAEPDETKETTEATEDEQPAEAVVVTAETETPQEETPSSPVATPAPVVPETSPEAEAEPETSPSTEGSARKRRGRSDRA